MKRPLFKGEGRPSHFSTGKKNQKKGLGLWLINFAALMGIAVMIFYIIFFLAQQNFLTPSLHQLNDEQFIERVENRYSEQQILAAMKNPWSPNIVLPVRVAHLIEHFDSPSMRDKLYDAAVSADEDVLLPSIALCRLSDMRGLERVVALARDIDPQEPGVELMRENGFLLNSDSLNPLIKEYTAENDLEFLLNIAQQTTGEVFEGEDLAKRQSSLLSWWTEYNSEPAPPEDDE